MSRLSLAAGLRHFAYLGAHYGPTWWLRYSPTAIGVLACALSVRERDMLKQRLGWVKGRPVSGLETLPSFINFAHCLAETLGAESHPPAFDLHGLERLGEVPSSDSGAIVLTAHTGAWELAAMGLSKRIRREVVLVMQPEGDSGAREIHERVRGQAGVRSVYVGGDAFVGLELIRSLRRGHWVAFQLDRVPASGRAFETRLFDRRFLLPQGPLRLARAARVPLIPVFCSRRAFLRHRLDVLAPTHVPARASELSLSQVAQQLSDGFEAFLRDTPHQWFDFEPRDDEQGGLANSPFTD